jgi:hypothetical protein
MQLWFNKRRVDVLACVFIFKHEISAIREEVQSMKTAGGERACMILFVLNVAWMTRVRWELFVVTNME